MINFRLPNEIYNISMGPVVDHSARSSSRETNGYLINNLIYCRPVPTRLEENENGLPGPGRFDITYLLVQLRSNEIAVIGKQIAQSGRGCENTLLHLVSTFKRLRYITLQDLPF